MPIVFIIAIAIIILIISSIVYKKARRNRFMKKGRKIATTFVRQEFDNYPENNYRASRIILRDNNGKEYTSERTLFHYSQAWLNSRTFYVYVDMATEKYYVDIKMDVVSRGFIIPILTRRKLEQQGFKIEARGAYIEKQEQQDTETRRIRTYYYMYVQESVAPYRIFKSSRVNQLIPPSWFEDYTFTVLIDPQRESKYIVEYEIPSIAQSIIQEAQEKISSYTQRSS